MLKNRKLGKKRANNAGSIAFFLSPAFIIYTCFSVSTIGLSIYYSLLDWDGISEPTFVGIKNYITIFTSSTTAFRQAILNSFVFAGASVFIQLPCAIFIAILVSNLKRGEKFYRTVFFIPVLMMTAITSQLWLKMYDGDRGLFNSILGMLGLESLQHYWLIDETTALAAVIIPGLWQWMGYFMLILYTGVKGISKDVQEAAYIDGANKFQTAIRITVPMIMPAIRICVTFMVVGSMKAFDLVYMLTRGGPFNMTEVPTLTMYITIFTKQQYGLGSSMTVVIIAMCMLYAVVINRIFKSSEDL